MQRWIMPVVRYGVVLALVAMVLWAAWAPRPDALAATAAPQRATFAITHTFAVQVPANAQVMRIWFAIPQEDAESEIRDFSVEAPYPVRYGKDSQGNKVGYMEIRQPQGEEIVLREAFTLTRTEIRGTVDPQATRPLTEQEKDSLKPYLQASTYVIVNDEIKALAEQIVGSETNPIVMARNLYDWTLENIDYWVKDPDNLKASPVGSTEYCLRTKTGNCTDFHALYASLARSVGLPTRIVYGSLLKPTLNGLDVDASYHCWVQVYAPNIDWLTLDVAVADIYVEGLVTNEKNGKLVELTTATGYHGPDQSKVDYYFGNLDERRVVWSVGRDLRLDPPQDAGPVNALTKMYVEVDGKEYTAWTRKFTYKEL